MDRYFGLMTGRGRALLRVGRNVLHSRFLACFPKIFYCAWTRTTLVPRSRQHREVDPVPSPPKRRDGHHKNALLTTAARPARALNTVSKSATGSRPAIRRAHASARPRAAKGTGLDGEGAHRAIIHIAALCVSLRHCSRNGILVVRPQPLSFPNLTH